MSYTYNKLVDELLKFFPELVESYNEMKCSYKHMNELPGVHIVFGDIFSKYIIDSAKNAKIIKLKMIFNFIEEMIKSKDFEVRCVAEVSVIEDLIDNDIIDLIYNYIKPMTLKKVIEKKKKWKMI